MIRVALSNGTYMELPDGMTVQEAEFLRLHEELHIQASKLPRPTTAYVSDPKTLAVLARLGLIGE